jgi:hypothetical protein
MNVWGTLALLILCGVSSAYLQSEAGMVMTAGGGFIWYCYLCVKK